MRASCGLPAGRVFISIGPFHSIPQERSGNRSMPVPVGALLCVGIVSSFPYDMAMHVLNGSWVVVEEEW